MSKFIALALILLAGCATERVKPYEATNNDEYIEQMEAETDAEIKSDTLKIYTFVGAGLFVAGVAMVALTPKLKSGVTMIAGGAVAMGSPFILNSVWFDWVFGLAFAFILLDGMYFGVRFTISYFKKLNGKES